MPTAALHGLPPTDMAPRNQMRLVQAPVLRWCARWAWYAFLLVGASEPPPMRVVHQTQPSLMRKWRVLARLWPGLLRMPDHLTLKHGRHKRSIRLRDLLR